MLDRACAAEGDNDAGVEDKDAEQSAPEAAP